VIGSKPLSGGWLGLVLLVGGCTVGPDFHNPHTSFPDRYTGEPLAESTTAASAPDGAPQRFVPGENVPSRWWTGFGSPALDALVETALRANPDLRAAESALLAARESALAQHGVLWPSVDLHAIPSRQSLSAVLASPQASNALLYTLHTAQLSVGYAVDVFGANRRSVEAADAQADVQRYQRGAIYLTLVNNVLLAGLQEAALRAQLHDSRTLIELATRQFELMRRQQRAGMIGAADVVAQEAVVAQARTAVPPLEKQVAQVRDQLAALTGRFPRDMVDVDPVDLDALTLPAVLPVSVPSRLVEQRPDVQAAAAALHAATAQVGVARAARLPSVTLTASTGSVAESLSELFRPGNGFWSIAADIAQPIFDGGALQHREGAASALADQADAQYRSTVLAAFQNVADALHAIDTDARALAAAADLESAARRSLDIVQRQWRAGSTSFPAVLIAEQTHQQAVIGLTQARAARYADTVALFQALGGDWSDGDPVAPER
jgi:NodT family efflux transporter outer membrane factor (OMF) lipoprotein